MLGKFSLSENISHARERTNQHCLKVYLLTFQRYKKNLLQETREKISAWWKSSGKLNLILNPVAWGRKQGWKTLSFSLVIWRKIGNIDDILTFLSTEARQNQPYDKNTFGVWKFMNFPLDIYFARNETRETKINFSRLPLISALKMFFLLFARANELKNRLSKILLAIPTLCFLSKQFFLSFTFLW